MFRFIDNLRSGVAAQCPIGGLRGLYLSGWSAGSAGVSIRRWTSGSSEFRVSVRLGGVLLVALAEGGRADSMHEPDGSFQLMVTGKSAFPVDFLHRQVAFKDEFDGRDHKSSTA